MSTATFDTYTAAKHLRDAGFDERQAEAAVSMVRDAVNADRGENATKAGVAELRAAMKADLAELRSDLAGFATQADLTELRSDLEAKIDAFRMETKADRHREIGILRSELRWILGFLAALIVAMAARLFGIV